jgi:hypothetical protein
MTWMSIANWYFKIGDKRIVMDGYITRVPESLFVASPVFPKDMYTYTKGRTASTCRRSRKVQERVLGPDKLDLLLAGHAHWDHSWDTPAWSRLTGAPMIGSLSACLQANAQGVAGDACRIVSGGEKISLGDGVTMRVVRWNHSGDAPTRSSTSRASCTGRRCPTRRRAAARRRRRGLSERRRQPRVPLHRRFARGPALVLRQQLGERVRPGQGHRRRRRQLSARRSATWRRR